MIRLLLCACLFVFGAPLLVHAHGSEEDGRREHTVYSGQRLGSIAKRYNVTIEALCNANGIRRRDPIRPGQQLLIPTRQDRDGSEAKAWRLAGHWSTQEGPSTREPTDAPLTSKPHVHTVFSGQRLGSIAKRYNVSVKALCFANGIRASAPIRPGQKLLVPPRGDRAGARTRAWRLAQDGSTRTGSGSGGSWRRFSKRPDKRNYLHLVGHAEKWRGRVLGSNGQVLSQARTAVSNVLTAPSNRQPIHARLIQLLAEVSNTFGGRPLRIISGYRTTSFVKNSRHKSGRAVDFRIPGVPNEVLRDFLRTLPNVGVGYYPNSTFVHLDVREHATYWVDYAGPGEAPKLAPR